MSPYEAREFLRLLAPQIVAEIETAEQIKEFTNNTDIIGAYVEASVRRFIRNYLAPIRVSTGGVIDQNQTPREHIPQLDIIAWIPGPVAAVFEVGDFGLVPRSSCLGLLEIKSSAYPKGVKDLDERTDPAFFTPVTEPLTELESRTLALNNQPLGLSLGVISLLKKGQRRTSKLEELRQQNRVAVIYAQVGDEFVPQGRDIYRLINFLTKLRLRASLRDGLTFITDIL
jgi:hypothetical protein